ncbi:MAG TPA: Ig-like domain-containing protein, partial [Gemmatimonadales bacterium]|nr:Ig-like domain-containing protein [Gemmatimonadales bacterium]
FVADLRSPLGTHLGGRAVAWTSENPSVAVVDTAGLVTPQSIGTTEILASSNGLSDSTRLQIVPEPVVSLGVAGATVVDLGTPGTAVALVDDSLGRDAVGNPVTWVSSDTSIITISLLPADDRHATLVAVRPGITTLTIAAGQKTVHETITGFLPATEFRFQRDSLVLRVGDAQQFPGALFDTLGGFHDVGYLIHYSSSDPTIAYADTTGFPAMVRGLKVGRIQLIGKTDAGWADTAPVIVEVAGNPLLAWNAPAQPADYDSATVTLFVDTTGGAPLPPPLPVTITSNDTTVVTASPASLSLNGQAAITLHARRPGAAQVTASSATTFGTLFVIAASHPPVTVHFTPRPTILRVGDTLTLAAVVTGDDAMSRAYPVTWHSSDSTTAKVSAGGLISALGTGLVRLRAASGLVADSIAVQIVSATALAIDSIVPGIVRPATTATVYGSGFDPLPALDTAVLGGVPLGVTGATATALTVTLPPPAAFSCDGPHEALLLTATGGRVAADSAQLAMADDFTVALGASAVLDDTNNRCRQLSEPGARYRVTVTNVGPARVGAYLLEGFGGSVPGPVTRPPAVPGALPGPDAGVGPLLDSLSRMAQQHVRLLEAGRSYLAAKGSPIPTLRTAAGAPPLARSPGMMINDIAEIRIPRIDLPDYCSNYTSVLARLVYAGQYSRIYEDVTAPLAGQMDAAYAAIGQEFDSKDYPELLTNYGDPLALDSLLDRSGRVTLLFSPTINTAYGFGAFTTICDFYPETVAPSSNTAEIMYGPVPTSGSAGFTTNTVSNWRRLIRSMIMHEAEHITMVAARLKAGAQLEEPWLSEAVAVSAEELWARTFYNTVWKQSTTYQQSLYCDVRPTSLPCNDRPYSMFTAFALLFQYGQDHQTRSPLGPKTASDASFVGSGWALLRWALDSYAASEGTFLKSLVHEPVKIGLDNLATRTSRTGPELLSDWFMAWTLQDTTAFVPQDVHLRFPSWNLSDIFTGMYRDFPVDFPGPFPVFPRPFDLRGSLVADTVYNLAPGTSAYYTLSNLAPTPVIVRLTAPGSAAPPPGLRVEYVRIH